MNQIKGEQVIDLEQPLIKVSTEKGKTKVYYSTYNFFFINDKILNTFFLIYNVINDVF